MTEVLDTEIGTAPVLHRLALAVECRDALSDRPVGVRLQVRWRRRPTPTNPQPAWRLLPDRGTAQYVLLHQPNGDPGEPLPRLELVVDDPTRQFVPRRFSVQPWTRAEVSEPAPFVSALARLVRVWLLPGSAYPFPGTATLVRGRVTRAGRPVRWARVRGRTPAGTAGWAHVDDRGEFVLPVTDVGFDPVRDTQTQAPVTLLVSAPRLPGPVDPADRTADLFSQFLTRPARRPTDAQLDNAVRRGTTVPSGFVANQAVARQATVEVGRPTHLSADVVFAPPP